RVAHVPGKAVDEIILAAMGFVGNDDDVPALAQQRVLAQWLVGQEFLDGGKDYAARGDAEQAFEAIPASCLDGRLADDLDAIAECLEELLVEVVAIREDDDRRIIH